MWIGAFYLSAVVGLVALIGLSAMPYPARANWPFILCVWAFAAFSFFKLHEEFEKEAGKDAVLCSHTEDPASTNRSQWERSLAAYVRQQPGCSDVRENDRTLIVASDGHTPLEIDIYIPSLRLGIEANGIKWHDREAYLRDRRNGTEYSEEMYKERYCEHRGIKLIHVWDEDGDDEVRRQIDAAIHEQRAKLY